MKKIFALFLTFIYFIFANAGAAFAGNLYFVKNSDKEFIKPYIDDILTSKKYNINQTDPYYATLQDNNGDNIVIILQKSSSNYFYYIQSTQNTSVNKAILKALKRVDIEYEESFNEQYLSMFENQAQKVLNNTVSQYNFSQPVVQNTYTSQIEQSNTLKGSVTQVPKGATFKTYLETPINTSTAAVGDMVRAVLSEDWVYNGKKIASQGSLLTGMISTARHAAYGSRNGRVVFDFTTMTTPEGKTYSISTDKVDFTVTNDGKLSKAAGNLAAGLVAGALVGLLVSAFSKDSSAWKSAAIGAGIGAGAGAVSMVAERGVDAEIPVYTELEVSLLRPLSVVAGMY